MACTMRSPVSVRADKPQAHFNGVLVRPTVSRDSGPADARSKGLPKFIPPSCPPTGARVEGEIIPAYSVVLSVIHFTRSAP